MIAETGSLLDRIRSELSSQRAELDVQAQEPAAPESASPPANGQSAADGPAGPLLKRIVLQPGQPDPESFHIRDLLRYYDQRFIDVAYRCLLKRDRDAGADYYLARLRAGKPRVDILHKLRYSPEGRKHGVRIPGMRLRRALSVLTRLPVIGYVINWLVCLATLPRQQQRFRQWRHHTMWMFTELENQLHGNFERLETALANPASQAELCRVSARVGELETCLSSLKSASARVERPRQDHELQAVKTELEQVGQRIAQLEPTATALAELRQQLAEVICQAAAHDQQLAEVNQKLAELDQQMAERDQRQAERDQRQAELSQRHLELGQRQTELDLRQAELGHQVGQIAHLTADVRECKHGLGRFKQLKVEIDVLRRRLARLQPSELDTYCQERQLQLHHLVLRRIAALRHVSARLLENSYAYRAAARVPFTSLRRLVELGHRP